MSGIFTNEFKTTPYWWEDYTPEQEAPAALPSRSDIVVIGAGYTGTSCALTLAEAGRDVVVLEAEGLGFGASSRSGGMVAGGILIARSPGGKNLLNEEHGLKRARAILQETANAMDHFEHLLERHAIACGYHRTGRIVGAWTPDQLKVLEGRLALLNTYGRAEAEIIDAGAVRHDMGSDFYFGGLRIHRAGHVQPALYYRGLMQAARRAGARFFPKTPAVAINRSAADFEVVTSRGSIRAREVVVATNGYSGSVLPFLRQRIMPVTSHVIATEEIPEAVRRTVNPANRGMADNRRVLNYYRLSPDGKRMIFGGRSRFYKVSPQKSATLLYRQLIRRFPQLDGIRLSHSWGGQVGITFDFTPHIGTHDGIHYCVGCNGSGVTTMTYLGHLLALRLKEMNGRPQSVFDDSNLPGHPLYAGKAWFLPVAGTLYQIQDHLDRRAAEKARRTSPVA